MKLLVPLSILSLAHLGFADFYIFRVNALDSHFRADYGWQIADVASPSCDQLKAPWYGQKSDVSGKTLGVRCDGEGCSTCRDPQKVEEMEMHFSNNPHFKWTIRSDNNFAMIGSDGRKGGECVPAGVFEYACDSGHGRLNQGYRKFLCKTSVSAETIAKAT